MKVIKFTDLEYVPASHENVNSPGALKKVLFKSNDLISGKVQMINWAKIPINRFFVPHYHEDMEEVFIVISGKIKVEVDSQIANLSKGDAVIVPIGAVHKMTNIGQSEAEYIAIGISQGKGGKTVIPK